MSESGHFETSRRIVAAAGPPPIADLWPGGRRFRGGPILLQKSFGERPPNRDSSQ